MTDIKIFENKEFGIIRILEKDGESWFVGKDVADALGYKNHNTAIRNHVSNVDKDMAVIPSLNSNYARNHIIINVSGLYSLANYSGSLKSGKFLKWITPEVNTAVRKNNSQVVKQKKMTDAELIAKALSVADKVLDERERRITQQLEQIKQQNPLVEFAKHILQYENSFNLNDAAK